MVRMGKRQSQNVLFCRNVFLSQLINKFVSLGETATKNKTHKN